MDLAHRGDGSRASAGNSVESGAECYGRLPKADDALSMAALPYDAAVGMASTGGSLVSHRQGTDSLFTLVCARESASPHYRIRARVQTHSRSSKEGRQVDVIHPRENTPIPQTGLSFPRLSPHLALRTMEVIVEGGQENPGLTLYRRLRRHRRRASLPHRSVRRASTVTHNPGSGRIPASSQLQCGSHDVRAQRVCHRRNDSQTWSKTGANRR
jgi:hypothetical protein